MTNLCIDIGNSFIKYAIIRDEKTVHYVRAKKLLVRELKSLKKKYNYTHSIISSTRKSIPRFIPFLERETNLIFLDHTVNLPFKNVYKTPKTLGKDRLAAIAGAMELYPKKHCLVFDIGTCMTIDFVNKQGTYLGGNIAPGKDLRLKSMHDYTSALPLVPAKFGNPILGKSTKTALQNGAIYGIILEIEAMVSRIKSEYGRINVILTGGDAVKFGELIECKKFVVPNLVLIGLNHILKYNVKSN